MKDNEMIEPEVNNYADKYKAIIEHLTEGIVIVDDTRRVIEWNVAMEAIMGLTRSQVEGRLYEDVVLELVIPENRNELFRARFRDMAERILSTGTVPKPGSDLDIEVITRDGTRKFIRQTVFTIPVGDKIHIGSVTTDVTKRKGWEEVLRQREIRYRLLFETANDGIMLMGEQAFFDCNNKALELFGCKREEILGRTPADFSPPLQPDGMSSEEKARGYILGALNNEPQFFSWRHKRIDGNLFDVEVSLNKLDLDGKIFLQAIVRDVTVRLEEHEQLKRYADELKELNNTKDKFFSIIAHDLKSPFNAIMGFSDILTADWGDFTEEERQHFVMNINTSAKNTFRLLNNLLEWAMTQTGKLAFNPVPVDLSILANEAIIIMREQAEKKQIKLFTAINYGTLAMADENMVRTILRNLVSNAIKFTLPGGQVRIYTQEIIPAKTNQRMVEVCVVDNGIGIPTENIPLLFRIGETVRTLGTAQEKGTGLGLILCRELIEKNKGEIRAESETGKGSKFCFTLPISD